MDSHKSAQSQDDFTINEKFNNKTLSLSDKVFGFSAKTMSELSAFKKEYSLSLNAQSLITLQHYFSYKRIVPTLLEILIINYVWSDYSYNNRIFNQVEVESTNPHIFAALKQYRELRKKTDDKMPTSGIDVINIGFASLAKTRGDIYRNVDNKHYFAFDAANKTYKKRYWLSVRTNLKRFERGETIAKNLISNILHEQGVPLQCYRKEFSCGINSREKERALPFASLCSAESISAYLEDSVYNNDFANNYELAISVNIHNNVYDKKIAIHDSVILIYPNAAQENYELGSSLLESLIKNKEFSELSTLCADSSRSIVAACLDLNLGVDIHLGNIPNDKKFAVLESLEGSLIAVINPKNANKIYNIINKNGLESAEIGCITNKSAIRIYDDKKRIANLSINMLKYHTPKYTKAIIKDKEYKKEETKIPEKNLKAHILASICNSVALKNSITNFTASGAVFAPCGGAKCATPTAVNGVIPQLNGIDNEAVVSTVAHNSSQGSTPFLAAINATITAISKLIAAGVPSGSIAVSVSSLFGYIGNDCDRGDLLQSRLGELYCQNALSIANIGGSTASYKGANEIHSVATAVGASKTSYLCSNVFKVGQKLFLLKIPRDEYGVPDFKYLLRVYNMVNINIATNNIESAAAIQNNVINTVIISLLGSGSGFSFAKIDSSSFEYASGSLIISLKDTEALQSINCEYLGVVDDSGIIKGVGLSLFQSEVVKKITERFEPSAKKGLPALSFYREEAPTIISSHKINSPRVFIPKLFSSVDCFVDAFSKAGAIAHAFDVPISKIDNDLIIRIRKQIEKSEIIAICTPSIIGKDKKEYQNSIELFRSPIIKDAINELLFRRDGLILGIGEGMRTLMQLGYLPCGKICNSEQNIKLTKNIPANFASHISKVKIFSNKGPWLSGLKVGSIYSVPIAIEDGRITGKPEFMKELMKNGQIPTVFVDNNGYPTMQFPSNPVGSLYGAESLISSDGRILGRLSYNTGVGNLVNKDEPTEFELYNRGVNYFK